MGDINPRETLRFNNTRLNGVKVYINLNTSSSSLNSRLIIYIPPINYNNLNISLAVNRVTLNGVIFNNLVLEGVTFEKVISNHIIAVSFLTLI